MDPRGSDGSALTIHGCPNSPVDPMTPILPPGHFTLHYHTMDVAQPWCNIWHLPHNGLVIYLGDSSRFTQWRSEAGSHNRDPKLVHTMEIYTQ